MFRNSQLLHRSREVLRAGSAEDDRPVAILADSNEAEVGSLKPILEKHNFRVIEAIEGGAALQLARQFSARIVVASLDLPRINGYQLCQKIREERPAENIVFILISPEGAFPDKVMGHETYASDYVQRPINIIEFENRLAAALRAGARSRPGEDVQAQEGLPASRTLHEQAAPLAPPPRHDRRYDRSHKPSPPAPREVMAPSVARAAEPTEPPPHRGTEEIAIEPTFGDAVEAERLNREYVARQEIPEETGQLYKEAFLFVLEAIGRAEKGHPIDLHSGMRLASRIVQSLQRDDGLMLLATDRSTQLSLAQHMINVAVIASRIAQEMELPEQKILRVCLSSLLHDIGTVRLPKKFISKIGIFTPAERAEMHHRPIYSSEILAGDPDFDWLPPIVAQTYERENGKGFPKGLKGKDILEEAKILGLANVFEACIHHRPYRRALTGYQSLEVLTAEGDAFSDRITKAMLRAVSVYPYNEWVELNTGEIGKVISINRENPLRPVVKVLYSKEGTELDQPKVTNLARNSSLWITQAVTPEELPQKT